MCVLAMAWRAHPHWPLVMAGNRDELHTRPAQPLAAWPESADVLAGRDFLSGGIWLGVSKEVRFAVVTNLRGFVGPLPDAPSRGLLLKDMLLGTCPYAAPGDEAISAFSPFNLARLDTAKS